VINFPIGLFIHLFMGSLMISNSELLSSDSTLESYSDTGGNMYDYLMERYNETTSAEVFVGFAITICLIIVMKNCFFLPIYNLCAKTANVVKSGLSYEDSGSVLNWYPCRIMGLAEHIPEETTSSSFYRELNPKYLKEIYIKAQNELKEL